MSAVCHECGGDLWECLRTVAAACERETAARHQHGYMCDVNARAHTVAELWRIPIVADSRVPRGEAWLMTKAALQRVVGLSEPWEVTRMCVVCSDAFQTTPGSPYRTCGRGRCCVQWRAHQCVDLSGLALKAVRA